MIKLYGEDQSVVYLSVDSGTTGYVCLHDPVSRAIYFSVMPRRKGRVCTRFLHKKKDSKAPDYDPAVMLELLTWAMEKYPCLVVVIEEPLSSMMRGGMSNAKSIMDLHRAIGIWTAICALKELPFYSLHPGTWKSKMGIKGMVKEQSLVRAAELLPEIVFPTVDAADAFLIGYTARTLRLGVE